MLTDHHAHWLPESLLVRLSARTEPPMAWREAGCWVFRAAVRARALAAEAHDLALRSRQLDRLGIDRQVLSLSPLWCIDSLAPALSQPLVRCFNDETARAIAAHPGYRGLAAVPTADVGQACDELRRVIPLGLDGVVLPAADFADRHRADRWAPLFELAQARRLRVFIHPGQGPAGRMPVAGSAPAAWQRWFGLEPQHEVGLAMLTLCQEGWLLDFPNVAVQVANLGGSFTPALERLQRMAEDLDGSADRRQRALAAVTVDSASLGPVAINAARRLLGAKAVVFGTDLPLFDAARAVDDWRQATTTPA